MAETQYELTNLPAGLKPYFQEYDIAQLDLAENADLIIQRTLEYGDWAEIHWLFELYGVQRIRLFLRQRGERWFRPVTFNYWRKLLKIRRFYLAGGTGLALHLGHRFSVDLDFFSQERGAVDASASHGIF